MFDAGEKVVQGVLPVLLKNGLTNPSDEIKAISLRSILTVSKNAVRLPPRAQFPSQTLHSLSALPVFSMIPRVVGSTVLPSSSYLPSLSLSTGCPVEASYRCAGSLFAGVSQFTGASGEVLYHLNYQGQIQGRGWLSLL